MDPAPDKIENVLGATPPVDENVKLPFTDNVIDVGEINNAGLIVAVEFAVAPNESVTLITVVPETAGAVNKPDDELMLPAPETNE